MLSIDSFLCLGGTIKVIISSLGHTVAESISSFEFEFW